MGNSTRKPSKRQRFKDSEFDNSVPLRDSKTSKALKSASRRASEAWTRRESKPLVCKNQKQKIFLNEIKTNTVTLAVGCAGTGKSFVALKFAAMEMDAGRIDQIIITRPAVEAGGGLGFLPGDVSEKTAPYQAPMLDILGEHFGRSHLENLMGGPHPKIRFVPLEHLRGLTLSNCFILFDESQNATKKQFLTLLTRLGENARMVIDGDVEQCDLKNEKDCGLADAIKRFQNHPEFGFVEFDEDDIVRSDIVRSVLIAYRAKL